MDTMRVQQSCNDWLTHGGSIFTLQNEPWDVRTIKHFEYSKNIILTLNNLEMDTYDFIGFSVVEEFGSLIGSDVEGLKEYIEYISINKTSMDSLVRIVSRIMGNSKILDENSFEYDADCYQLFEPDETTDAWFYVKGKNGQYCLFLEYED